MSGKEVLRTSYVKRLEESRGRERIKVITGVRRCGKTTVMRQFFDSLRSSGVREDRLFTFSLEDPENLNICGAEALAEAVMKIIPSGEECFLFLDEVSRVEGWEKAAGIIHSQTSADIYAAGCSLSAAEAAASISGECVHICMFPLSFAEWTEARGGEADLMGYLTGGGFPMIDSKAGQKHNRMALRDLYGSIVAWDISSLGRIRNVAELDRIMTFMMHNIGNPISVSRIVRYLGTGRDMVERYLSLMEQAHLLYRAERFDQDPSVHSPHPKYYVVDTGFRDMSVGFSQKDGKKVLENAVFIELLRRGYRVSIGRHGLKEIDFIAVSPSGATEYYQVCAAPSEDAAEQESLRSVKDGSPKTLLTMTPGPARTAEDGITARYAADWMLDVPGAGKS